MTWLKFSHHRSYADVKMKTMLIDWRGRTRTTEREKEKKKHNENFKCISFVVSTRYWVSEKKKKKKNTEGDSLISIEMPVCKEMKEGQGQLHMVHRTNDLTKRRKMTKYFQKKTSVFPSKDRCLVWNCLHMNITMYCLLITSTKRILQGIKTLTLGRMNQWK